jgi:hypothetical protein
MVHGPTSFHCPRARIRATTLQCSQPVNSRNDHHTPPPAPRDATKCSSCILLISAADAAVRPPASVRYGPPRTASRTRSTVAGAASVAANAASPDAVVGSVAGSIAGSVAAAAAATSAADDTVAHSAAAAVWRQLQAAAPLSLLASVIRSYKAGVVTRSTANKYRSASAAVHLTHPGAVPEHVGGAKRNVNRADDCSTAQHSQRRCELLATPRVRPSVR